MFKKLLSATGALGAFLLLMTLTPQAMADTKDGVTAGIDLVNSVTIVYSDAGGNVTCGLGGQPACPTAAVTVSVVLVPDVVWGTSTPPSQTVDSGTAIAQISNTLTNFVHDLQREIQHRP